MRRREERGQGRPRRARAALTARAGRTGVGSGERVGWALVRSEWTATSARGRSPSPSVLGVLATATASTGGGADPVVKRTERVPARRCRAIPRSETSPLSGRAHVVARNRSSAAVAGSEPRRTRADDAARRALLEDGREPSKSERLIAAGV